MVELIKEKLREGFVEMKKLCSLLFLLFLVACGLRISGGSYTRCTEITGGLAGVDIGQTVITVQGYDEDILLWTVTTTLTREEFDQEFLHGIYLSDDEIHELFEAYTESEDEGITFYINALNNDYVIISMVYDYAVIADLDRIWNVDDFESTVTLSSAIAGLEDHGAICETTEQEAETEEEDE